MVRYIEEEDMEAEQDNKDSALREIFDETTPKPWAARFIISVFLYAILSKLLFHFESPIYIWVIAFFITGVINICIWGVIREYQFSKFKDVST